MLLLEHRERVTASVLILGIFFGHSSVLSFHHHQLLSIFKIWFVFGRFSPDPFSSSLISVSVKSFGSFNYSSLEIVSCRIIIAFLITLICADITLISMFFFSFRNFQKPFYIIYNIISYKKRISKIFIKSN